MDQVALLLVVAGGVILLTPAASALTIPQPVLLTVFGLGLGLLPVVPDVDVQPEVVLPLVLPPLLFAATQRTTVGEFRKHAAAVLWLAVGLTIATAAAVAWLGSALGLDLAMAFVLGAVVSPPDPVAATAVARRLRLPDRLVTILEGEGMFNDATALVLYKVATAAVVTGSLSVLDFAFGLAVAVVVGLGVGLVGGFLARMLLARIHDGYAETTVTVFFPFVAFFGAEELQGSGVLAVLVLGLYLRSYAHEATTSGGWLLGRAVWSYADFLVTSVVFSLLGLELVRVMTDTDLSSLTVRLGVSTIAVVVALRFVWVAFATFLTRRRARRRDVPLPFDWRESTVVGWAGMRGVVTVATVLAVPTVTDTGSALHDRDTVIVVALACVLFTLVVQGVSLAPLTTRLGVGSEVDEGMMVADLRSAAAAAALEDIRGSSEEGMSDEVRRAAVLQYEGFLAAQEAMGRARRVGSGEGVHDRVDKLDAVLRRASDVERSVVLSRRRHGEVTAAAADEVMRDIEARAVRDAR